jgi:hypothetical protein
MWPISALRPQHAASWFWLCLGSILGKYCGRLSVAPGKLRNLTYEFGCLPGVLIGIRSTCLWEGLAELPLVARQCPEPSAAVPKTIPMG